MFDLALLMQGMEGVGIDVWWGWSRTLDSREEGSTNDERWPKNG